MKKLREFMNFEINGFMNGKSLVLKDIQPYYAYVDGARDITKPLGVKYNCLIASDMTKYKDGITHINEFETVSIKVPGETATNKFPRRSKVEPVNITKAVVFGDYQNSLSIEAEGMRLANKEGVK